jgi:hypothetical protein
LIEQMNDVVNRLENLWGVLTIEKLTIICGKTEDNEKTIKQNNKKKVCTLLDRRMALAYNSCTIKKI